MVRLIGLLKLDSYFFSKDFGYTWIEQCVHTPRAFLSALVQRLKDQHLQSWYAELADSSKLCLYSTCKDRLAPIACSFCLYTLLSIYVFSYFPFGFEGRIWDLIVLVPDHCLSFYFTMKHNTDKHIFLSELPFACLNEHV